MDRIRLSRLRDSPIVQAPARSPSPALLVGRPQGPEQGISLQDAMAPAPPGWKQGSWAMSPRCSGPIPGQPYGQAASPSDRLNAFEKVSYLGMSFAFRILVCWDSGYGVIGGEHFLRVDDRSQAELSASVATGCIYRYGPTDFPSVLFSMTCGYYQNGF
jgi:hypothetical protein